MQIHQLHQHSPGRLIQAAAFQDSLLNGGKTLSTPAAADKQRDGVTDRSGSRHLGPDSAHRSVLETQNFPGFKGSLMDFRSFSSTFAPSEQSRGINGFTPALSVVGAPVAVVAGHQAASDEQDEVHEPPDAQAPQGEQLPHRGARVAQAEAVDPKAAQEEGVEQCGDEVVPRVPAWKAEQDSGLQTQVSSTFLQVLAQTLPSSGELVSRHILFAFKFKELIYHKFYVFKVSVLKK